MEKKRLMVAERGEKKKEKGHGHGTRHGHINNGGMAWRESGERESDR